MVITAPDNTGCKRVQGSVGFTSATRFGVLFNKGQCKGASLSGGAIAGIAVGVVVVVAIVVVASLLIFKKKRRLRSPDIKTLS